MHLICAWIKTRNTFWRCVFFFSWHPSCFSENVCYSIHRFWNDRTYLSVQVFRLSPVEGRVSRAKRRKWYSISISYTLCDKLIQVIYGWQVRNVWRQSSLTLMSTTLGLQAFTLYLLNATDRLLWNTLKTPLSVKKGFRTLWHINRRDFFLHFCQVL